MKINQLRMNKAIFGFDSIPFHLRIPEGLINIGIYAVEFCVIVGAKKFNHTFYRLFNTANNLYSVIYLASYHQIKV